MHKMKEKKVKKVKKILLLAVLFLGLAATAEDFAVVKQNKPCAEFVIPKDLSDKNLEDLIFFNKELEKVSDATLEIRKPEEATGINRILIDMRKNVPLEKDDEYTISFPDEKTMKLTVSERSLRWVLVDILKQFGSVTYLFRISHKYYADYPAKPDFLIPRKEVRGAFSVNIARSIGLLDYSGGILQEKEGNLPIHAMNTVFPPEKYLKKGYPKEILPLIGGKRVAPQNKKQASLWNPCFSSPKTAEVAIENLLELLKKEPNRKAVGLAVNDLGNYCQCETCIKIVKNQRNSIGYRDYSEIYWKWANTVVAAVAEKYPDVIFGSLAYREVLTPPKFHLHKNIIAYLCFESYALRLDPKVAEKRWKLVDDWSKKADRIGHWEYAFGCSYFLPRIYFRQHADFYRKMYKKGLRAVFVESGPTRPVEGPKCALLAKLFQDINTDEEQYVQHWCCAAVGKKAAPYLRKYYRFWEEYWQRDGLKQTAWFQSRNSTYMSMGDFSHVLALKKGDLAYCRNLMDQIEKNAETPEQKECAAKLRRFGYELPALAATAMFAEIIPPNRILENKEQALELLKAVPDAYKAVQTLEKQPKADLYFFGRKNVYLAMIQNMDLLVPFLQDSAVRSKMPELSGDKRIPFQIRSQFKVWLGVPVKNLLENGSFENAETLSKEIISPASDYTRTKEYAYDQAHSIKLNSRVFRFAPAPLEAGKTYIFSIRAFVPKSAGEGIIALALTTKHGKQSIAFFNSPEVRIGAGTWNHFALTVFNQEKTWFGKPADNLSIVILLKNFEKGETVYIDDAKLLCLDDIKD